MDAFFLNIMNDSTFACTEVIVAEKVITPFGR